MTAVADGYQRIAETKAKVEAAKIRVRNLQVSLATAKATAEGQWPRQAGTWRTYQELKKEAARALNDLGAVKLELTKLSGTTGGDPRWTLLVEAWQILSRLDEDGVDIGERGHALIDDIEFHVPASKLHEAGQSESVKR